MNNFFRKSLLLVLGFTLSCASTFAASENVDTVRAKNMLLAFYTDWFKANYDSVPSTVREDSLLSCLTTAMVEKLGRINNASDCNNINRAQDTSGKEIKSLRCRHLEGDWFMVSFGSPEDGDEEQIPVKVSGDSEGRLKISYITPVWGGTAYGDKMLAIADVKVRDNKTALAMVSTFFKKYARTYATMPESLAEDIALLRRTYCTERMLAKFDKERENEYNDGWSGYDAVICGFDFDALWYPQLEFLPVNPREVIVKFNSRTLRVNVVKAGGHYRIDDIAEVN